MPSRPDSLIRAFGMSGYQISAELTEVEEKLNLKLGHLRGLRKRRQLENYDQFDRDIRAEASLMSEYYEIFYCLEQSIRRLISETLREVEGGSWWEGDRVPPAIRDDVEKRHMRELDSGVSARSELLIDYTTFGELAVIIKKNWDMFEPIFSTEAAVTRVLSQLNLLRGPIAHCCQLSEDEALRLELAVRDWFRIMS